MDQKTFEYSGSIYSFDLDNDKVLWFSGLNKYLVVQRPMDEIIPLFWENTDEINIAEICAHKLQISHEQAEEFVSDIQAHLLKELKVESPKRSGDDLPELIQFLPSSQTQKVFYRISDQIFLVEYETRTTKELNHPKFAHFEIKPTEDFDNHFKIYHQHKTFALRVNGRIVGSWREKESHFLNGKFMMQILQKIHDKEENEWIGVFHAAGVSKGKSGLIFLGDSGSGKSTLSALLMSRGYEILSDDFLPLDKSGQIGRFPAALSIKKQAVEFLKDKYPQLVSAEEHRNEALNKTFRYLPMPDAAFISVPCNALVFVNYHKGAKLRFQEMHKTEAIKKLIPDSWISPEPENAARFIEWYKSLPCYELVYSNNVDMFRVVEELFA